MRWGGLQAGDLSQLRAQSQTAAAFQEMLEQMKRLETEAKPHGLIGVVASQSQVPNANGHIYAPYVPLHIQPISASQMVNAQPMSVPGGPTSPVVNFKRRYTGNNANPYAEIFLDMSISSNAQPILFRPELFQDEHRERDNIIWRVPEGVSMFPIYSSYHHGQDMLELRSVTQRSTREYFCHDDNLHEMRPYAGYSLEEYANGNLGQVRDFLSERQSVFDGLLRVGIRASEYMVYEFPKHVNDGSGWLVGFASHYENFIANTVDFDDDEIDEDLDINTDIHYRYRDRADERLGDAAARSPHPVRSEIGAV
jgi:hypothetical protein